MTTRILLRIAFAALAVAGCSDDTDTDPTAEVYGGPQMATITGTLDGQPVDATIDRADACGISTWEDLLGPVLPATEGAAAEG